MLRLAKLLPLMEEDRLANMFRPDGILSSSGALTAGLHFAGKFLVEEVRLGSTDLAETERGMPGVLPEVDR